MMRHHIEIMVVDDSPAQLQHTMEVLERKGYRVRPFTKSESALKSLRRSKPQMLITAVALPGIDGYELCRIVKGDPELESIPVVLLTALSNTDDVMRGLEAGADNFIIKPFDENYLISRLHNIVENQILQGQKQSNSGYEVVFNGRRYFVTAERHKILELVLSTYEAAILKNLALQEAQEELKSLNENLESLVDERTVKLKREISERMEAEARIREQATLLDKAHDAITVVNVDGKLTYWNEGASQLYGWLGATVQGRKIESLVVPPEGVKEYGDARAAVLETGYWQGELIQANSAGDVIVVESRWTLVRDSAGEPKSILMISIDITEKKRLELEFLRAQRLQQIGSLAGGIAHDLNNIFSPMIMGLSLLRQEFPDHGWLLDSFNESARRGVEMVQQILVFARGGGETREPLDARDIIHDLEHILRDTFPRTIQITTDLASQPIKILCNRTQVHQVLLNLSINARDAMDGSGDLRICAETLEVDASTFAFATCSREIKSGSYASITISDTGCGMSEEVRSKIFQPFFTTNTKRNGTGLGLSTSLSIVKSHGGYLDVESTPAIGSKFRLLLPAIADGECSSMSTVRTALPLGKGECVLIIDDERSVREIAGATLDSYGYRAFLAQDGAEGTALCARHLEEIQVVITDMLMPRMDGRATILALRQINPALKIIATSGAMDRSKITGVMELKIDGFLPKPFTAETLVAAVSDVLADIAVP